MPGWCIVIKSPYCPAPFLTVLLSPIPHPSPSQDVIACRGSSLHPVARHDGPSERGGVTYSGGTRAQDTRAHASYCCR